MRNFFVNQKINIRKFFHYYFRHNITKIALEKLASWQIWIHFTTTFCLYLRWIFARFCGQKFFYLGVLFGCFDMLFCTIFCYFFCLYRCDFYPQLAPLLWQILHLYLLAYLYAKIKFYQPNPQLLHPFCSNSVLFLMTLFSKQYHNISRKYNFKACPKFVKSKINNKKYHLFCPRVLTNERKHCIIRLQKIWR